MTKREELQKQLKDAEDTIAKVRVELENEEKKPKKHSFRPVFQQRYYYLAGDGSIQTDKWDAFPTDTNRFEAHNVFETRELAEQEWAVQLAERRVRAAAKKHGVLAPAGESTSGWSVVLVSGQYQVRCCSSNSDRLIFSHYDDAQGFLDEVGQETYAMYNNLA